MSTTTLAPARRPDIILATCCLSLFIVGVDVTIVNIALPSIQRSFGASIGGLQWTVDAYTLVLASLLMLSGSLADRFGRRRIFQTGLLLFTIGSLLCSFAPGLGWLIGFRMLQAVGGSMLNPVAMAIIVNTFTEPAARARAVGAWGSVMGLSLATGPVLGGALVSAVGWRAIFWVNVPVGLAAIALTRRYVPESRAAHPRRLDPVAQVLIVILLAGLTAGIIEGPRHGWGSPLILGCFAAALLALIGVVVTELHRREPLIDIRFFASAPFSGATVIAVTAFAAMAGFLFLNTLYLQTVRGYSPVLAGLLILPMAATTAAAAPLSGRLVAAGRGRWALALAGAAIVAGAGTLMTLSAATPVAGLVAVYVVFGIGFGLVNPAHLEHRRLRDAGRPGRRGRVGGLHQPPGRRHPRRRHHRYSRGRPQPRGLHGGESPRMGRCRTVRAGRAPHRPGLDEPVGPPQRAAHARLLIAPPAESRSYDHTPAAT